MRETYMRWGLARQLMVVFEQRVDVVSLIDARRPVLCK